MQRRPVGDCCYAPWILEDYPKRLGARYLSLPEPRRAPILIRLPGDVSWCPDLRAITEGGIMRGEGWDVVGDLPQVTISPSVVLLGRWHGWIRSGVISDDLSG
jgi:hypothetical protein